MLEQFDAERVRFDMIPPAFVVFTASVVVKATFVSSTGKHTNIFYRQAPGVKFPRLTN